MALDQSTDALLKNLAAQGGPALHELPVAKCREVFLDLVRALQGEVLPIHACEDREIAGPNGPIGLRIYTPAIRAASCCPCSYNFMVAAG
jgi:hypothetical protein